MNLAVDVDVIKRRKLEESGLGEEEMELSDTESFEDPIAEDLEEDLLSSVEIDGGDLGEDGAASQGMSGAGGGSGGEVDCYPHVGLTTEQIVESMREYIRSAISVLQLPPTTMRHLLNHFGWDKDTLMEAYFSCDDSERDKFFEEASLLNPLKIPQHISGTNDDDIEECQVCFDQVSLSDVYGVGCGHRFCKNCWISYLTTQIMSDGLGQRIRCMAESCQILVDDLAVKNLIKDKTVQRKYQQQICNSFVECNRHMKWCPSPGCSFAVKVQYLTGDRNCTVICKCGHQFCFRCAAPAHVPVSCDMLKTWTKRSRDDSGTYKWIEVNTKQCPKCNVNIEKNGGCNFVRCGSAQCGVSFCWICFRICPNHDRHKCNEFKEDLTTVQSRQKSREDLQRYMFYYDRYASHQKSLKLESKLHHLAKRKMEKMRQCSAMSWLEVQFLKIAVDVLSQCRQTLIYTYVFAFYVTKNEANNQIEIFKGNQEDLQTATERLSGLLEQAAIPSDNLVHFKFKVQHMYQYCESRRQVLVDHVREGHEKDWWKFQA